MKNHSLGQPTEATTTHYISLISSKWKQHCHCCCCLLLSIY